MSTDICIIGGGLVGLMAASVMSAQGRQVSLVEAGPLTGNQPGQLDVRSIALSLSSLKIMQALGLYPQLHDMMTPISDIHISSAGHFGVTRLHASDLNLDYMGAVVEYHSLMRVLLDRVTADPGIEIIAPAQIDDLHQHEHGVTLNMSSEKGSVVLDAAMVLVADGASSKVRQLLGIDTTQHDYHQSAIIANVQVQQPKAGWAYERFTPSGPLAMLPLSAGRYAMVWTRKPDEADQLMQADDKELLQQLHQVFGYRLGYMTALGKRDRFDLMLTRASQLADGRCLLIGNAANALHPVAGQGFNLALRDIGLLYDQLKGLDLSSTKVITALSDYEKQRLHDQHQTIRLGHGLVELFSNSLPVLNHARAAALAAFDLCPLARQEFSWVAMGYGAGTCSLMRGVM